MSNKHRSGQRTPDKEASQSKRIQHWVKHNPKWTALIIIFIFAGIWIVSSVFLAVLPSGFLTIRIASLNGYQAGSSTGSGRVGFSESGYFCIPDPSGVMWEGYAQPGNARMVNKTWLGWQQVGNISISATEYFFTFDVLAYLTGSPQNIIPTASGTQYLRQYYYKHVGLWGAIRASFDGGMTVKHLNVDPAINIAARLAAQLHLDTRFEMFFDATRMGQGIPLSFDEENGVYSVNAFSVTSVAANADPFVNGTGGIVAQPTVVFNGTSFSLNNASTTETRGDSHNTPPSSSAGVLNGGDTQTECSPSAIETIMTARDGKTGAAHFAVDINCFVSQSSSAEYQSMLQMGMPITLYTNGTDNPSDLTNAKIYGTVPVLLKPQVLLWNTRYSYFEWEITAQDKWFTTTPDWAVTLYAGRNPSYLTLAQIRNPYVIQRVQTSIIVASNYTWTPDQSCTDPSQTCYAPDLNPPTIDGADGSLDPLPDDYVSFLGADIPVVFSWEDLIAPLIWIGVIAAIILVIWLYLKFSGGKREESVQRHVIAFEGEKK